MLHLILLVAASVVPPPATNATFVRPPLHFERNEGQVHASVRWLARGGDDALFLADDEAVLSLRQGDGQLATLRMRLIGAESHPTIEGSEPTGGVSNYFVGRQPSRWRAGVPHMARVTYRGVYPGIDVTYHGERRRLEYDFVVRPGADPDCIRVRFDGTADLRLDADGNVVIPVAGGDVVQQAPVSYQTVAGVRREIASRYVKLATNEVGFSVAAYDRSLPLTIDPVIEYSTYLGGDLGEGEYGDGIAVDGDGNAYVTGRTWAPDFPVEGTIQTDQAGADVYITKLAASGSSLVYSTYLGGDGHDYGHDIDVDSQGNAYVTGQTASSDFPVMGAAMTDQPLSDGFVAKLSPSGTALVYSTYLGGNADEYPMEVAIDGAGNAYVTGQTTSTDFPMVNALQGNQPGIDAFVTKVSAAGDTLIYSTYLGGNGYDFGHAIAVDANGSAVVTGITESTDFPLQGAVQTNQPGADAFVTRLSPAGNTRVYSTYLGGNAYEIGRTITLDGAGNAYVAGYTQSTNFPVLGAFQGNQPAGDAFVTKLSASGASILASTYLGGSLEEDITAVVLDTAGNVYVTGHCSSTDFPLVEPMQMNQGGDDACVAKLAPSLASLVYSTYLGGSGRDTPYAMAIDTAANVYVTGITDSTDFPTLNPFQTDRGGTDAFVTKITPAMLPKLSISDVSVTEAGSTAVFTVTLSEPAPDPVTVNWATTAGGAHAATDFVTASGTLTFAPSATVTTVGISIVNDAVYEATERFFVDLNAPVSAALDDARGRGSILDDDPRPELSVADAMVVEGNSGGAAATFTVTLAPASLQTVSVDFATGNAGTAAPGGDYIARNGTLKFYAGQTSKTFAVTAIGDTNPELDETFYVNLTSPVNAIIGDGQARGTITNDDPLDLGQH